MSISNLLYDNNYALKCDTLTANTLSTTSDVPLTTKVVSIYQQGITTNVVASNLNLYYYVKNKTCYMWMNEIPLQTFSFTSATTLLISDPASGVVDIPLPATSGNYVTFPIFITSNGSNQRVARLGIDGSYGNSGQLYINAIPFYTVGTAPSYTLTIVPGSNSIITSFSMLAWSVTYPVA